MPRKHTATPSHVTPASFKLAKWERPILNQVISRAERLGLITKDYPRMTLDMDLCAAHGNNGNRRLDLERLLVADDFNFMHDITGIARHMDRTSGKLGGHFVPRFTVRTTRI